VARRAEPTYRTLVTAVQKSPFVVPDETGWRENGYSRWLWVFTTPTTTVYRITGGRSFADAALVLPATYAGVLTRDGWVAYRDYTHAGHQSCLRHLLRRCELLMTDYPHSRFASRVQRLLQTALAVRDRRTAGTISDHGVAVSRGRLAHQLDRLLETPGSVPAVQRFARHLDREFPYLFSFLEDPTVDATNWRAEQAIRPAVVTRKVCGGNRSARGVQTQYILATLVRTASQRHVALPATIATLLRSPRPIVPEAFRNAIPLPRSP
jgi:transposase